MSPRESLVPLDRADAVLRNLESFAGPHHTKNPRVLASLAGPAWRGLVLRGGKAGSHADLHTRNRARFDWSYTRDRPALRKLTEAARRGQWDPDADLPWAEPVDPFDPARPLLREQRALLAELPAWRALPERERAMQLHGFLAWMLSQFLHGEQGALFAACQVTESVGWLEGKLYGSTQVADEGRHVEVFDRYLGEKLGQRYPINDNLFVVLDSLMGDRRWDVKFLGMQILVEGLALGAFATIRSDTGEPLLRELLRRVVTDEARHVHFGVLALQEAVSELSEAERAEREDWAYEMCLLLRNRFLAHEFFDEHWAHAMSRRSWDRFVLDSAYLGRFRHTLFRRIVPNLRRVGLLSGRVAPHYAAIGLLEYAELPAAPELSADDLLAGT